jgi:hypothetical protein
MALAHAPTAKIDPDQTRNAAAATTTKSSEDVSHQVNAAGTHPRGILRWGYFIVLNAISAVVAVALFIGVFYADGLDKYMRGTYDWLLAHPGVTSFMAFSPLAASLLVGWGYSQRARKRREAAARAAAAVKSQIPTGEQGHAASGEIPKGDSAPAELPSAAA